jgi:hypothetical protein
LLSGVADFTERQPALPRFMAGLSLIDGGELALSTGSRGKRLGVVLDHRDGTVSASVSAQVSQFGLLERADQDRLLQGWGDALAGFCTGRNAAVAIRVTERAAPGGQEVHVDWFDANRRVDRSSDPAVSYSSLLDDSADQLRCHETLITVTVDPRRLRQVGHRVDRLAAAINTLVDELRLLSGRLAGAGLLAGPPLSLVETAEVLRVRCDPFCAHRVSQRRRSLAELAGAVSRYNAGPMATEIAWSWVRVDRSVHRTYWVAEWPRLDLPPAWLGSMLLFAGPSEASRTFTICYEPISPSQSARQVRRDATRLASDTEHRARAGFRIGAAQRRVEADVARREAELVAGFPELAYSAFLTISAKSSDSLEAASAEWEQTAATAGLELRSLDGRHDLALLTSLPVGRGLTRTRSA